MEMRSASRLASSESVPQQWISRHGLRTILRPESEQHNVSLSTPHIDHGRFPCELLSTKKPPGYQRIDTRVVTIPRNNRHARLVRHAECRRPLEPDRLLRRRISGSQRIRSIELDAQDRARRIKVSRPHTVELILHRERECADSVITRVIESDQRATIIDESGERFSAGGAESALERIGVLAERTICNLSRALFGKDDRVESRAQAARTNVTRCNSRKGNPVLIEDPPCPSFVHGWRGVREDRNPT